MRDRIGIGSQGEVWRGSGTERIFEVAVKIFHDNGINQGNTHFKALEMAINKKLPEHTNVINYLGLTKVNDESVLIMEYFPSQTLYNLLWSKIGNLNDFDKIVITKCMLSGLKHLVS